MGCRGVGRGEGEVEMGTPSKAEYDQRWHQRWQSGVQAGQVCSHNAIHSHISVLLIFCHVLACSKVHPDIWMGLTTALCTYVTTRLHEFLWANSHLMQCHHTPARCLTSHAVAYHTLSKFDTCGCAGLGSWSSRASLHWLLQFWRPSCCREGCLHPRMWVRSGLIFKFRYMICHTSWTDLIQPQ